MKTTNKILILSLAVGLLAGCNFFDNDSPSASSSEMIFSNVSDTERAIAAVYELFGYDRGYRNRLACGYAGLNTDIEYCRKSSSDFARYQTKLTDSDLSNAKGNDAWGYLNAMIERCNNIVEGIDNYGYPVASQADSAKYDYYKGEAMFLRAFAMLEMVKYWGDIPVNVKAFNGMNIAEVSTAKVDRNIAFEQIRTDLLNAANLMNWSASAQVAGAVNDVRRPSKAAALALLARADLMYAGKSVRPTVLAPGVSDCKVDWNIQDQDKRIELYKEVMWACDTIISEEGDAKLLTDYERVFRNICEDVTNYAAMEQIWVIPFANGARGQVMNYNCLKFNTKSKLSTTDEEKEGYRGWNRYSVMNVLAHNREYNDDVKSNFSMSLVPTLLFDFDANDKRRNVTIVPYRWKYADKASDVVYFSKEDAILNKMPCLYPEPQSDVSQWACGKYRIEWMSRDNSNADDGIDFPVIRMADVYLMYAEAAKGSLDEIEIDATDKYPNVTRSADAALNAVRKRADLPFKSATLEVIQDERKYEFAGEYIRKWDLMRWGILRQKVEEAHEKIVRYRNEYGDNNYLYFTYKIDNSVIQPGAIITRTPLADLTKTDTLKITRGYVVESISSELEPSKPSQEVAKIAVKCKFAEKCADDVYIMYDYAHPETLESRQYWPIFATVLGASNGLLFNNYGY